MISLRKLEELLDTPYEVKQIPLYFWLEYFCHTKVLDFVRQFSCIYRDGHVGFLLFY